jgi:hypothetical protein
MEDKAPSTFAKAPSTIRASQKTDDTWIPDGFVELIGPNDEKYILPEFMLPALDQDYKSDCKKVELKASSGKGTVSYHPV